MGKQLHWLAAPLLALQLAGAGAPGDIERRFAAPPPDTRMATYLWSFGPAWTKEELRRHLTLLEKAGIGRVLFYPLYPYEVDDPARGIRNLNYLSPEFLEMLRYGLATARELGLESDLVMGTGWPYGGPMIPETLSPKRIVMQSAPVAGAPGGQVTMAAAPTGAHEERIAVLLVPKQPGAGDSIDLSGRVGGAGQVTFQVPEGEWLLMSFLQSPTTFRHKVIYAAAGAGGNVIDHLDPRAVGLYLEAVGSKLAAAGKGYLRALYCPSMEVDGTCWTPAFLREFQERRGYDLKPHLSALFRDEGEKSLHIRRDFWDTVQQLAIDVYLKRVGDWIRSQGMRFQAESYGTPPVRLSSFGAVDYPMGEDCDWKQFNRTRWASSAAHFYGRRAISVEAYTGLRYPARYNESLQDLKIGSDLHFVSGANRMVMHGYAYSPQSAGVPGWGYFAGIMATENNTWWPYFHHLSKYVQRTGYILSQGVPVVDVALYLPEDDVFADTPPGYVNFIHVKYRLDRTKRRLGDNFGLPNALSHETDVVKTILTNGYSLDGIDHSILPVLGKVEGGRLQVGDSRFPVIVLPGIRGLPLEDLEKIAEFCRQGGTVIATLALPRMAYGYQDREAHGARFRALMDELYGGVDTTQPYAQKAVGKGRAIFSVDETATLAKALGAVPPDLALDAPAGDIGFVHRRAGSQDFYFVANFSGVERRLRASFRVGQRKARLWDPMTGQIRAAGYEPSSGRTVVDLDLEPWGSTVVEFGPAAAAPAHRSRPRPAGSPLPVDGPWKVSWPAGAPGPSEMRELKSWTEFPQVRFFSGRARYETVVEVPRGWLVPKARVLLDMGDVREIAGVSVNGSPVAEAWKLPYRVDVTPWLKPGRNTLRIEATNLLINRVIDQPAKDYSAVEARYPIGTRVPRPQEKKLVPEPVPSGLLGPVKLWQLVP